MNTSFKVKGLIAESEGKEVILYPSEEGVDPINAQFFNGYEIKSMETKKIDSDDFKGTGATFDFKKSLIERYNGR